MSKAAMARYSLEISDDEKSGSSLAAMT